MKSIIRLFKRKNSSGFTLVEIVVALALLAVLMAGMMIMITPIVRSFNDTSRDLVAENVSTCVQSYITSSIRNANQIVIFANTNDTKLKENGNTVISDLKKFCQTKTSDGNDAYTLKCISLRYDSSDQRYYLYTETINTSGSGDTSDPLNAATRTEVFSRCLYNDLYINYDFDKPLDMDKTGEAQQPVREDALQMSVETYADAAYSNLIFAGTGLTELRQIKKDIAKNGTGPSYKLVMYNGEGASSVIPVYKEGSSIPSCGVKTSERTTGAENLYIYYVIRNMSI